MLPLLGAGAAHPADFQLADGDRVVFIGNTLIEREQNYGWWEAALTVPDKNITFRNLGWSGDTVWGEAMARFGSQAEGFKHLREHVTALKPTVVVVGYGLNESFAGEAGLPRFTQGLNTLLDMLATTKARVVLLSPLKQEDLGRPLPDPTAQNKNIALYRDTLKAVAEKRGHHFVDLFDLSAELPRPLTDNGLHLSEAGYRKTAAVVQLGLGVKPAPWQVTIDKDGKATATGVKVEKVQSGPVRFTATDETLPALANARVLTIQGLPAGKHTLKIDGKPVATASAAEWAAGVKLTSGPDFDQAENMRKTIREKNETYFHRWRPQNETYLFGFRKNEQGKNAKEIAEFDPIVAKLEGEIARLRVPTARQYEVTPAQ